MTIQRLENVGIAVDDLAAATAFSPHRLCYVHGPEAIIIMLAQQMG